MADEEDKKPETGAPESGASASANDHGAAQQPVPGLQLITQYVRDLSFENPGSPASLITPGQPKFNVNVSVQVKKQTEDSYAVEISIAAKADRENGVLFNVELVYGGLYRVRNFPEEQLAPLLMIECPRLIFPFARQVLANVTQQGGFPPLLLEPVDFAGLYRQNLQKLAEARKEQGNQPVN